MGPLAEMKPRVVDYLARTDFSGAPLLEGRSFSVRPLAQGEYNLNYLIESGGARLVFRVNMGTQIGRDDQILYEFRALELLKDSGVTPSPVFVDPGSELFERGISIMEYLSGDPLDYRRDLGLAAGVFAATHKVAVPDDQNHLIQEDRPHSLIYDECSGLLRKYFESDLADPAIRDYLMELESWAGEARASEDFFARDPWNCVVNTEVNNRNFIVGRALGRAWLVDWEMPRWGDPSSDLCHFCSPLTTLWKTDYRMDEPARRAFIEDYADRVGDAHLRDTIFDRVRLRDPFVHLRGISWSAMGWVAYQTDFAGVRNEDTWRALQNYMRLDFIRSLFDRFMDS